MASPSSGGRSNDSPGIDHQHLRVGVPRAVPGTPATRAHARAGGDEALPHPSQPEDAGHLHPMRSSDAGAPFLRPSPLPALSAPREPAMARTPARQAGAGAVLSDHLHASGPVPGTGLGAPGRALRSADA